MPVILMKTGMNGLALLQLFGVWLLTNLFLLLLSELPQLTAKTQTHTHRQDSNQASEHEISSSVW